SGVIEDLIQLKKWGSIPVIVHGGGRVINEVLKRTNISSEFIGGHRKTDAETMRFVEMALSGHVNSELVQRFNQSAYKAVGLSGKDGGMVRAKKRTHQRTKDGKIQTVDLGFVGDVEAVDPTLIRTV